MTRLFWAGIVLITAGCELTDMVKTLADVTDTLQWIVETLQATGVVG